MAENLKIIPEIVVDETTYQFKTTRHLRVKYEDFYKQISEESKLNEEQSMRVAKYNNSLQDLQTLAEKFQLAKVDYFNDITNKDLKEVYLAYKEAYETTLAEIEKGKEEMALINNAMAQTLDIYERCVIEALTEQHGKSKTEAVAIWKDFVGEVGREKAREYLFAIGDELFNTEVEEKGFLAQRQEKLRKQAEQRKQMFNKKK